MCSYLFYLFIVYLLECFLEICYEGLYLVVVFVRIMSSYFEWKYFGVFLRKYSDEYFLKINVRSLGYF